jgi:hypothetical protein
MNTLFLGVVEIQNPEWNITYLPANTNNLDVIGVLENVKQGKWMVKVTFEHDLTTMEENFGTSIVVTHELSVPVNTILAEQYPFQADGRIILGIFNGLETGTAFPQQLMARMYEYGGTMIARTNGSRLPTIYYSVNEEEEICKVKIKMERNHR